MIDDRWEQDTLFLVFEEDFRFRPDEEPQVPTVPIQPANLAEPSAASGSQRCSRQVPSVRGLLGVGVSSSQTMARVYWPPQTPEQPRQMTLLSILRMPCEPSAHGTCQRGPIRLPMRWPMPLAYDPRKLLDSMLSICTLARGVPRPLSLFAPHSPHVPRSASGTRCRRRRVGRSSPR